MNSNTFALILVKWWDINKRELPWKNTKDPYQIWISEIILQQTRVEQGKPYFDSFIKTFPSVNTLAIASEDKVLKLWEGLGYYSRARNLHYTAKHITTNLNGIFPDTYANLLKLKGVGPNSAAAISSFAYNLPHAVVDGNVLRLISRILGIMLPVDLPKIHKQIFEYVSDAILYTNPASFNQALMDFGSMICTPQKPDCVNCIFNDYCVAYANGLMDQIPVKTKKTPRKQRYFHFFDIRLNNGEQTVLTQRSDNDIWKKLYELPKFETNNDNPVEQLHVVTKLREIFGTNDLNFQISLIETKLTQILTHQKIHGFFYEIHVTQRWEKINPPYYLVKRKKVLNFAFPKIINEYIKTSKYI